MGSALDFFLTFRDNGNQCFRIFSHNPPNQMQRSILFSVVAVFALSFALAAVAQENGDAPATAPVATEERLAIETRDKETSPANRGLRPERATRVQVPSGYGPVVNPSQRTKIHDIQREYNELIALLRLRIELLEMERNAKIEDVMTPEQLRRINRPLRRAVLPR